MSDLYVGVDPSITNTGVVLLNKKGDFVELCNTKLVKKKYKKNKYGYKFLRLLEIKDIIMSLIKRHCTPTDKVYIGYEDYSYDSINKAYTTGELGGVLKSNLLFEGYKLHLVPPKVLKKFVTGKGTANKDTIKKRALSECSFFEGLSGKEFTDDIADAFYLAKFVWYARNPRRVLEFEKDENKKLFRTRLELSGRYRYYA